MSAYQVIALFVRLGAVWLALRGVSFFSFAIEASGGELQLASPIALAIGIACELLALVMWLFPVTIARKLLPRTGTAPVLPTGDGQVTRAVLAVGGIVILVFRGPEVAWAIGTWVIAQVGSGRTEEFLDFLTVRVFEGLVQVLAGVLLVTRTRTLMRWLSASR